MYCSSYSVDFEHIEVKKKEKKKIAKFRWKKYPENILKIQKNIENKILKKRSKKYLKKYSKNNPQKFRKKSKKKVSKT